MQKVAKANTELNRMKWEFYITKQCNLDLEIALQSPTLFYLKLQEEGKSILSILKQGNLL